MELVDSVLAFALVMAALASVVTLLMEAFHRVLRLRAKGMEALFSQFYDDVLTKKLHLDAEGKEDIARAILINPAKKIILDSSYPVFHNSIIEKILYSTDLSSDDLLKRLSKTKAFKEFKENAENGIRETLESIQDEYNEYSAAMSDYFTRRAKFFSLLIGVLLAFGANIDGVRIYEALKINPEIRASIISQQASIEQKYKLAQQKLDAVAFSSDATNKNTQTSKQKEIKELKKSLEEAASGISEIASLGLPIGWHYFPANKNNNSGATNNFLAYMAWVFKILVTGLLIGLGAPFWFEVARKLTRIKQGLKGKGMADTAKAKPAKSNDNKTTIEKIIAKK